MKKILLFLLGIFFISSVYALGCCFDSNMGTCSPNSESSSCSGGEFYNDPTCSSVGECDYGCCQIGPEVLYTRQVTCYQRAQTGGNQYQWFAGSESQCTAIRSSTSNVYGACVRSTRYDKLCTYTTQGQCSNGNFSAGKYCSNPILGMNCSRTSNSTCFNEDVHYLDSCGNVDEVKSDCNYAAGSICRQESSSNAVCKSLNCDNGKKNGDSWCVPPAGIVPGLENWEIIDKGLITVGSRYFRQYCLNGEVFTEPCADYREETCDVGASEAKCKRNNYEDCFAANGEEDPLTGLKYKADECDENSCIGIGANDAAPCAFLYGISGEPFTSTSSFGDTCKRADNAETMKTNAEAAGWQVEEVENYLLTDLGMGVCAPVVAPGSDLNSNSASSSDSYCSYGDYTAQVVIQAHYDKTHFGGSTDPVYWYVKPQDDSVHKFGYAGLISVDPKMWSGLSSSATPESVVPVDNLNRNGNNPLNRYVGNSHGPSTLEVSDTVIMTLNNICLNMGDCAGKASWVNSFGNTETVATGEVITGMVPSNSPSCTVDISGYYYCGDVFMGGRDYCNSHCTSTGATDSNGNPVTATGSSSTSGSTQISTANADGGSGVFMSCRGDSSKRTCTLNFKCEPYTAPDTGDCGKCGADGLPCSEYRCQAISKGCEYFEPQGADRGYCVSSSDHSAPSISYSLNPPSPIPPYSSVEVTVNTNEDSVCAFSLGSAGSTYDGMGNELGNGSYSKQHKVILNVPGVLPPTNNETSYSLITRDGNYSMYVRCQDPAGNWNLNAYLISFNVMQTPDTLPPVIQSISPNSGAYLPYNTTQKDVSIKLNEPSECKWSTADKNFSEMENSFLCDSEVTDYGLVNGYFCTGTITNVTLNLTQQSKYYIKCKDQPWLEGNETDLYHRNVNPTSREYVLKPSTFLTVTEVSPQGNLIIGPATSNFTLTAKTTGGPESGKSSCSWKYSYQNMSTLFYPFTNTNSSSHSVVITNISEGNFNFQIRCQDIAGNLAYKNATVQVRIDRTAPLISRVYNDKGNLKLYTDEESYCKYMFAGGSPSCIFSMSSGNLTAMYGTSALEHTTPWKKGFTYLVKCADFYGNENSDCGMIIKTY